VAALIYYLLFIIYYLLRAPYEACDEYFFGGIFSFLT